MEDNQVLSGLDLSSLIDKISKNPEIINVAKDMLSSVQKSPATDVKELGETDQSVPAGLGELASLLPHLTSLQAQGANGRHSDRDALLKALRPYLSSARRETLDLILSIEKLGSILASVEKSKGQGALK